MFSDITTVNANLAPGVDTLVYAAGSAGVTVNLTTGLASGFGTIGSIANITGGDGNDTLTGSAGVNILIGNAGNDVLAGLAGNDTIFGNTGNDTILYTMGDGADVVDGGGDSDTLNITGGAANANDVLDVIYNGSVITSVESGAVSNVELINANLNGGTDTLSYAGSNSSVSVNLAVVLAQTASGFNTLQNVENVTGGNAADTIIGSAVANVLIGGAGADTITGGAGADAINVGTANDDLVDLVIYTELTDAGDTVTNFDSNGAVGTDDLIAFGGNLSTLALGLDDVVDDNVIAWAFGNGANGGNTAAALGTVEALFLAGTNGEGTNNGGLTNATTVANEFNSEFAITGAGDAFLVVNSTNGNNFAVWHYLEAGTAEIQAAELQLFGIFTSNADVAMEQFAFIA